VEADHDLIAQLRRLVAEDGMSDAEVEAVVEDALANGPRWAAEDGGVSVRRLRPLACRCGHPLELSTDGVEDVTCCKCGRRPAK
jgi:hypothetical protein